MDRIVVTIAGLLTIAATYWFFFGKKEETMDASGTWNVTVDGGYKPSTIRIKKDKQATITFLRKDANGCLEEIVFPDYKIKEYLPLNKEVTITLPPPHPQTSIFHCGMGMFHGRIEVIS